MLQELYRWIEKEPETHLFTFFDQVGNEEGRIHLKDLAQRADAICHRLVHEYNVQPGDRVILSYLPSLEFIHALMGCMFAGAIPVPVYPPSPHRFAHELDNLQKLAMGCNASLVLTDKTYNRVFKVSKLRTTITTIFRKAKHTNPPLTWIVTNSIQTAKGPVRRHLPSNNDVAFLQHTSGSTSRPKGVKITWQNLIHQLTFNRQELGLTPDSRSVLWVPQYHDLGLISGIMSGFYGNGWLGILSPLSFLKNPAVWFELLSREKATHTAAPNFAYALVVRKTTPAQRAGWDLSHLEVVMNAAEPVRPETTRAFLDAFAPCGLRSEAWCPAYGLAEHSVGVTVGGKQVQLFSKKSLEQSGTAILAPNTSEATVEISGCGPAVEDIAVKIVDPETHRSLPEGKVGEIWVDSLSKADGYWGLEEQSREAFQARIQGEGGEFLRTGDMGFFHNGELFVSGRLKDMLIVGGRNLYPNDIEDSLRESHPKVRPGGIAAFSLATSTDEPDRLGVIVELKSKKASDDVVTEVLNAVRHCVLTHHQLHCAVILITPPGVVPKTTSGKIRRRACRDAVLAKDLKAFRIEEQSHTPEPASTDTSSGFSMDDLEEAQEVEVEPQPLVDAESLEFMVHEKVAELMGLPSTEISVEIPLMEQGLSSLQAVALSEELQTLLGSTVSPALVFEQPTIQELALHLSTQSVSLKSPKKKPLPAMEPQAMFSSTQKAYALQAEWLPRSNWNFFAFELKGELQPKDCIALMKRAFQEHSGLRTVAIDGKPVLKSELSDELLSNILQPIDIAVEDLDATLAQESSRDVSLEASPLHAKLLRIHPKCHILLLWLHHIAYDHVTLPKLAHSVLREAHLYHLGLPGYRFQDMTPRLELPQRESVYLHSEEIAQDQRFWENALKDQPSELVYDASAPVKHIPHTTLGSLQQFQETALRHKCLPNSVLMWAYGKAMMEALDVSSLTVGINVDLRAYYGIDDATPCAFNAIPVTLSQSSTLQEAMQSLVHRLKHARLPLKEIVACSPHDPPPPRSCLPVMFHSYLGLLPEQEAQTSKRNPEGLLPIQLRRIPTAHLDVSRSFLIAGYVKAKGDELVFDGRYQPLALDSNTAANIPVRMHQLLHDL